jgi:hypothetical protein
MGRHPTTHLRGVSGAAPQRFALRVAVMRCSRSLSRRIAWWALLVFVGQTLAMSFAAAARPVQWIEACTPAGIVKLAWPDGAASAQPATGEHGCTWCELMSGAGAATPLPPLAPPVPTAATVAVDWSDATFASRSPWAQLPIRAPPGAT